MASDQQPLIVVMLLSTFAIGIVSNDIKGPFDVCERDTFNATCPNGEVILMESAMYGRMTLGTCIQQHVSSRNCDVNVLDIMDGFCSGLSQCAVRAIHPAFFDIKRCPEHAAYLSLKYRCLKANADSKFCSQGQTVDSNSGYLASSQRNSNGAGTSYCPWTIISTDNTPINFTLYKFVPFQSSPLSSSSSVCFEIGTIIDGGLSQGILSCGSDPRTKPIYLSKGVEVRLHFKDESFLSDLGNFVIHFNVVGCGDPAFPSDASFKRLGAMATITCNDQSASWDLRCERGRKWVGEIGQCSKVGEKGMLHWIKSNTSYSIGLLGIVTIACAVVIFVGGFCIYVTHFYITRRQSQPEPNSNYTHTMDIYKLQTMQRLKRPPSAVYERTTSLPTPPGTMRRNTDYQRMNPIDPDTVSHHSYVLYDHVPKPLPPIPIDEEKKHIYETPLRPDDER